MPTNVTSSGIIPFVITSGGTQDTTLTAHGVLLGEGTSPVSAVAPSASSGLPLVSQGVSSDPIYSTLSVAGGGTGDTSLPAHNVLIGEGTSPIVGAAPSATAGVPLISAGASVDPAFGTAVVAGGGTGATTLTAHGVLVGEGTSPVVAVSTSSTSGVPLVSTGSGSDPAFGTAVVAGGGTGATSFTAYSVICGGTANTNPLQNVSGLGTSGQVLTSNGAGTLPTWGPGGTGIGSWILISSQDISGLNSVAFTSGLDSYDVLALYYSNFNITNPFTTAATCLVQISIDGGATYINSGYIDNGLGSTSGFFVAQSPSSGVTTITSGYIYMFGVTYGTYIQAQTFYDYILFNPSIASVTNVITNATITPQRGTNALQVIITSLSGEIFATSGKFSLYGLKE